jgi:mannose-1-phosphate guanylyltransferase
MILAAGLGMRFRPLTLTRPKVLAPVQHRPLLHWLVDYLRGAGAEALIINAHHLNRMLVDHVRDEDFGIPVQVRVERRLLDTGGAIRNVADFWDGRPFVVVNGDILSSVDLQGVLASHTRSGAAATLVLTDEPRFNCVQVGGDGRIAGFSGRAGSSLAFTGIQVLDPSVLEAIPAGAVVSIIDSHRRLIAAGRPVMGHQAAGGFWRELGTPLRYLDVHRELFQMEQAPLPGLEVGGKPVLHPSVRLGAGVQFTGMACIGAGSILEDGVRVEESILWDQVRVKAGCCIRNSIVTDGVVVRESVEDAVIVAEGAWDMGCEM